MSEFKIWRRILSESPRGQRVDAAREHIAGCRQASAELHLYRGEPYPPGREARFLVLAETMDCP